MSSVDQDAVSDAITELDKMINSKGWMLLVAQFRKDARTALMKLAKVDPTDLTKILALQSDVKMYSTLVDRPYELIQSGLSEEDLAEAAAEDTPEEFRIEEEVEYERQEAIH